MSQLRWILLTLGALFIAGLAWWELRRPRQAPREGPEPRDPPREPALSLPQMRAREPVRELPVMQIRDAAEPVAVVVPAPVITADAKRRKAKKPLVKDTADSNGAQ